MKTQVPKICLSKMNRESLKKNILLLIKSQYPNWIGGIEIERLALSQNYKSSNASRRARELVHEGHLERKEGYYVEYRWTPPQKQTYEDYERELLAQATR